MNNAEMADRLAARTGLNKAAAKDVVDNAFATICEALADGDEVRLAGFGTFAARTAPARTGRNPRTGEATSKSASTSQQLGILAAGAGNDRFAKLAARLRCAPPITRLGRETVDALTFELDQSPGAAHTRSPRTVWSSRGPRSQPSRRQPGGGNDVLCQIADGDNPAMLGIPRGERRSASTVDCGEDDEPFYRRDRYICDHPWNRIRVPSITHGTLFRARG